MPDITSPMFNDEAAAREYLESVRWPDGPICPHCGECENVTRLQGASHRPGVVQCNSCRKPFTVTVGTLYERSHIPLHKWLLATHLMCASKKGVSAHQLHRMFGITYKSAWFMAHRIREALRESDATSGPLGGDNEVVEVDETYVGGKAKNRKNRVPKKEAVVALVQRDGRVRSFHVARVNSKTLKPILNAHIKDATYVMTDESPVYPPITVKFDGHGTVNHSIQEYVRGGFWHTNTVEGYFSIMKRGIYGVYHHVSEQHLKRYLGEYDFRFNERAALGISDEERTVKALKGIAGKRLTYRRIDDARPN